MTVRSDGAAALTGSCRQPELRSARSQAYRRAPYRRPLTSRACHHRRIVTGINRLRLSLDLTPPPPAGGMVERLLTELACPVLRRVDFRGKGRICQRLSVPSSGMTTIGFRAGLRLQ